MMKISDKITGSKNNKNDRQKENRDTNGPPGNSGASGGNDEMDSNSNLSSGPPKRDASGDEKASEMAKLLAIIKLNNQFFLEQQLLRWSSTSSHGNSIDELSQKREFERRRSSLPSNSPEEQQPPPLRHQRSEPLLRQMNQSRELKLGDPLAESVLNNLELLEGLGKCLDKQHKYGTLKCWKHLSEHFRVEAKTYEDFTRNQERSPTEDLFEFQKTRKPKEFTVGWLKDKLSKIDRPDVGCILLEFDDETQVGSLFDSHPQVIANMAFWLDKEEKAGKRNWKHLADMFGVPRSDSQNFGESLDENPTEMLFEYLCCKRPLLTIGEVKTQLKILKMQDVLDVLAESKKVEDNSPLKDLWEDLEIAASVFNLLNKKHTTGLIRRWRLLGNKLGVEKDTLDTFSNEGEMISPTEVLIHHLGATRPRLIMADLIWALERIGRTDAFSIIEVYFPDGHNDISRFLDFARAHIGDPQQQITQRPHDTEV